VGGGLSLSVCKAQEAATIMLTMIGIITVVDVFGAGLRAMLNA